VIKNATFVILLFASACTLLKKQNTEHACSKLIAEDFYVETQRHPEALLLDTRMVREYEEERIPGARFAGNRDALNRLVDSLDRFVPLYIYCEHEDRTSTVCNILIGEKGFKIVYELQGGYYMWKKLNLPVDTSHRQVY